MTAGFYWHLGGMNMKASTIQLNTRLIIMVGNANDIHDRKLTPVSLPKNLPIHTQMYTQYTHAALLLLK